VGFHHRPTKRQEALVEAVRAANPIESVVADHTQLRRSGAQLIGRCPFHDEKTPSFSVNTNKQVFHCFGCGKGGDVFGFVRLIRDCSFNESLAVLAARAGIEIDGFQPSPELSAKVSALKAQREADLSFEKFCAERTAAISREHRDLSRAATLAEESLQAGTLGPYEHDLAWGALERFRNFQERIEREGLLDIAILRAEWERAQKGIAHVAA
jgi:DNA primase